MLNCISNNYPYDLPFYEQRALLRARKRLLLMLLSRRGALRVICAPSLYGKSVLAYQYAKQVFQDESVHWIDASEPSFLLALDDELEDFSARFLVQQDKLLMQETLLSYDTSHSHDTPRSQDMPHSYNTSRSQDVLPKTRLFVIDGCPYLDDDRFETLRTLIGQLLKVGHEVILTTDDSRWFAKSEFPCQAIDAQLLLLDEREHALWSDLDAQTEQEALLTESERSLGVEPLRETGREKKPAGHMVLDKIVGCRGKAQEAYERFVGMLANSAIRTEEEALAMVMLLLGSGALHELRAYVADLSDALLVNIERRYPHAGITALSPMFAAVTLDERDKFQLICRHANAIFHALKAFKNEDDLVTRLIEQFMRRDQIDLATQLACGLHDEERRQDFLNDHRRAFLFAGHPLSLLHLANTLPRSFFEATEQCLSIAIALKMLDESELAARVMRSFRSCDRSATDELTVLLMEVILDIAEHTDSSTLAEAVERHKQDANKKMSSAHTLDHDSCSSITQSSRELSSLTADVVLIIERTLKDLCDGHAAYQRFAAGGHSIKESLYALDLFIALLLFCWGDRLARPTPHEREMLAKLEQDIVYVLMRQATLLPPNMLECHLFDQARKLFDEQIYLHIDDSVLNRIESFRTSIANQRNKWRADHLAAPLVIAEAETPGASREHTGKKALRINTLGRFEIKPYDDGVVIKNKVRKQLRLLISLLAINNGRELARPWVQRIMWPNAPERNAKQNLYTMWSLLNRSVTTHEGTCPFFESYPHSLSLNAQLVETDTQLLDGICKRLRYETLEIPFYEKAIEDIEELYRGPLLPGDDTAEVVAHRKKYQERLIEALLKSGEHLRKCGETTLALRYFRFAFDNEPTREDVCYQLMLVLWKLGRHGEALSEYFVCRRALIDTFGIEGGAQLRELYETILNDAS